MTAIVVPTRELRTRLAPQLAGVDIRVWPLGSEAPFPGAVDLLVLPYMIRAERLRALEGLPIDLVQSQTLGYDGVRENLPAGIAYCNAVDVHEEATAELALALILASLRGIPDAVREGRQGHWVHRRHPGLAGKRVLIVGVGGVGSEIVWRIAPFGADLDLVGRTPRDNIHGLDELPRLLTAADVVVIAIPLTPATRRMVDGGFLSAMPDGALLVNVSRGEIVDTDALVAEVRSGRLRAALDVTDPEPLPRDHPLWQLPGVLVTPHVGGDTDAMDARIDRVIVEQVRRLRARERPANLIVARDG